MGRKAWVSLHSHSALSPRDGLSRVEDLTAAAAEDSQPALAVTDHGTLSGAWKLAKAAKQSGIKPIMGMEAYLAVGSRLRDEFEIVPRDALDADGDEAGEAGQDRGTKKKTYEHLTVLAQNAQGYQNLSMMAADSADHFWGKPRMDFDLLREHHDGLILLTGCISGPVAGALARDGSVEPDGSVYDGKAAAKRAMDKLLGVFDGKSDAYIREHLFVEIMEHGIPAEQKVTARLIKLAEHYGLCTVATNDSHYTRASERSAHDMWLCVGQSSPKRTYRITDADRWSFTGDGYHLRSYAEMAHALSRYGDAGLAALHQSQAIAESIDEHVLPESRIRLPEFPTPDSFESSHAYFKQLVEDGAARRYGSDWRDRRPDVRERLNHEAKVIRRLGFIDYFLIVRDVVDWARANNIRVGPGRGSAAGSMVSYAWASSRSIRWPTVCCSNASWMTPGRRCPTSTWTSTLRGSRVCSPT